MTLLGSPTSIKTLKEAGIEHADLFVGVMNEESRNMTACMIAHALGAKKTVARIDNIEYLAPHQLEMFEQMGINSLRKLKAAKLLDKPMSMEEYEEAEKQFLKDLEEARKNAKYD